MTLALEIILWSSIGLVALAYIGYPLAIYAASRLFGRLPTPPRAEETGSREWPKVSVLVSALNEEKMIAERIENNLAQDYPADRLEIVVASDGSTDRTASIVRDFAERFPGRVRLLDYPVRRGKATVLNESIPALAADIVALSDANTFFEPPAISRLVRWFDDPSVGVVCGKLLLLDPHSGRTSIAFTGDTRIFSRRARDDSGRCSAPTARSIPFAVNATYRLPATRSSTTS